MNEPHRQYPPPYAAPLPPPAPPEPYRFGFGQLTHTVQAVLVIALVVTVAFAACLGLGINYMLSAQRQHAHQAAQIAKLSKANTALAGRLAQQHQANGKTSGDLSGWEKAVSGLLLFDGTCSQDFTGPNGPAQYFFPCTETKPGTSTSTG